MIRLFAAIAIPAEIAKGLAARQTGIAGARWRPVDSLHITLAFAGEVQETVAEDIDDALSHLTGRTLTLTLEGVGMFGDGPDIRAVWAGVGEAADLALLAGRCERAMRRAGAPVPRCAYRPHVTLAYLRRPDAGAVARWLQEHALLRSPAFEIQRFGLYSSWRTAEGSHYVAERSYPLPTAGQGQP